MSLGAYRHRTRILPGRKLPSGRSTRATAPPAATTTASFSIYSRIFQVVFFLFAHIRTCFLEKRKSKKWNYDLICLLRHSSFKLLFSQNFKKNDFFNYIKTINQEENVFLDSTPFFNVIIMLFKEPWQGGSAPLAACRWLIAGTVRGQAAHIYKMPWWLVLFFKREGVDYMLTYQVNQLPDYLYVKSPPFTIVWIHIKK